MLTLQDAAPKVLYGFGQGMFRELRDANTDFEDAAQAIVERIYHEFVASDGNPLFALVRIFRLCQTNELPDDVYASIEQDLDEDYWITLMASYGLEENWRNRRDSRYHKALSAVVDPAPMFEAACNVLRLDVGWSEEDSDIQFAEAGSLNDFVYIEDAMDSRAIVDKDDFVKPYGIQSVIGMGSPFLSHSFYLMMCFAREYIPPSQAESFAVELSPFISSLLASYDSHQKIWT